MTHRDLITRQDLAFMAQNDPILNAQEAAINAVSDVIETGHIRSATTCLLKQAEHIQRQMLQQGKSEAAKCMGTAIAAIQDSKEEL